MEILLDVLIQHAGTILNTVLIIIMIIRGRLNDAIKLAEREQARTLKRIAKTEAKRTKTVEKLKKQSTELEDLKKEI